MKEKRKAKILTICFMLLTVLAIGRPITTKASSASIIKGEENLYAGTASKRKAWYKNLLNKKKRQGFHYYRVLDINRDGKKEIIISNRNSLFGIIEGARIQIWGRKGNKTKLLFKIIDGNGDVLRYSQKYKTLIYFTRMSGVGESRYYRMKKGVLKQVLSTGAYGQYHYPPKGYNKKQVFTVNKKRVSKEKYDRVTRKYDNTEKDIDLVYVR